MKARSIKANRVICSVLAVVLLLSCVLSGVGHVRTKALGNVNGLFPGIDYRIRHVQSGRYLTMDSVNNADNVTCSLQARMNSDVQRFRIIPNTTVDGYAILPKTVTSSRGLSLSSTSTGNNNTIVLKTLNSSDLKGYWSITTSPNGHKIQSKYCSKYLGTYNLGTTSGTKAATQGYQTWYTEWALEPAVSGSAMYFTTDSDMSSEDSAVVDEIIQYYGYMGYTTYRHDLPVPGMIQAIMGSMRVTTIHGHGSPGRIRLDNSSDGYTYMYASDVNNIAILNSYLMLITCSSGTASSTQSSMVDAFYDHAKVGCVTGFRDSVRNGEDYYKIMAYYLNCGYTIYQAMANADLDYLADHELTNDSPANTENRITRGSCHGKLCL